MNQDQRYEEERLRHVNHVIERKLDEIESNVSIIKNDANQLRKEFRDDFKINLDSISDKLDTFASLHQQNNTLAIKEQTRQHIEKQYKVLSRLQKSPYFARIDFKEDGSNLINNIYIGIATLRENEDNLDSFLIYDWRAPISSLYYDHVPGPAQYEFGDEKVAGEMLLKRQFILKNGLIESMFDTNLAIVDEMLKEILGKQASTKMKNIVATIQKDQNQMIRNTKSSVLIIQGAAGSGKTSVALQRVAFLLYQSQNKLTSENMLLFSPNPIFSSYVSTVLPELGVESIQQITFQEYVEKRIGKQIELESPFEQMEFILSEKDHPTYPIRKENIQIKAGLSFKKMIDSYIETLSEKGMIFKSISFNDEILISAEEIKTHFYSFNQEISIANRINETARWLLKNLSKKELEERESDWVIEEIELSESDSYFQNYIELDTDMDDSFDYYKREQDLLITKLIQKRFKPIRNAIKALRFVHATALYHQFFKSDNSFHEHFNGHSIETWLEIRKYTVKKIKTKVLPYEDQAPYLYLMDKLIGNKVNRTIKQLFIDEAQDYSPIQFHVLKQLFPSSKMTILGDFNQAIFAQSYDAKTMLSSELYGEDNIEKTNLNMSYRSTKEIVEFSKGIIKANEQIEAFDRSGPKPTLTIVKDSDDLHTSIAEQISLLEQKYDTISIICKTGQESRFAFDELSKKFEVQLVNQNSKAYRKGIVILPTYLAKGVEFDAVIIYNASSDVYAHDIERNILYTSCTRAMHELHLFSIGESSPYLKNCLENE
ncbi:MAG: helicase [Bacillales bacterium]|jgi:DNA helicase-2/ATP-dependent DNA helicase PcrA|nr:helicase [Bacillales bacterium]